YDIPNTAKSLKDSAALCPATLSCTSHLHCSYNLKHIKRSNMTSFSVRAKLTPRDPTDTAAVQAVDCPICHGFTQPNLIQLHELVQSCRSCAGCYFFQGLIIALTRAGFDIPLGSSTPLFLSSWSLWGPEHFLTVARCELQKFMHWQAPTILAEAEHFEIFSLPGDKCPWPKVPIAKLTSGDTSSLACISQLQAHLARCMREHKSCSSIEHVELPTRVLEIHDAEGDELKIRLKVTNGEVGRYICLSHRWLEGKTLTTTTSTMGARTAGIPWADLPKVFQEAITVTHKLGFRYIWIDSLAINQEKSSGDWLREAPKMAQYYQNSSLTISAAESAESLFYRFPDEAQIVWNVQPPERFQQSGYKVGLRKPLPHDVSALHQRGWVYQEHILSPRIAHFGKELIWECSELTSCECGRLPLPTASGKSALRDAWDIGNVVNAYGEDVDEKNPERFDFPVIKLIHCRWLDIIAHYSRRTLTYGSDIFPALAGLTKQFQLKYNEEYCAGLWKETLGVGLLWRACDPNGHPKPVDWRAPSWSWASTTSPVDYYHLIIAFELTTHTFR
ncbi:heterokaryon incompatibility protein-domain-containing protein, partial [Paraphoma chrysanthemicola]